ncbi:MAG TPA: hypothetical protein PLU81_04005 [Deltaproteobacteria bacterium]|nr:hypothetical protein [Deltaproteobacteria bacterium]
MRVLQAIGILLGVILCTFIILIPLALEPAPFSHEIWLFQTIDEMHAGGHIIPWLNRLPLIGPNPVNILVLSFSPFSDILSLRLISILAGCILTAGVFLFSLSLWDKKSAALSTLLTITSCGFVLTNATLNTAVVPCTLTILAFLLFSLTYLKGLNSWRYLLSYLLISIATITGGWTLLAFFGFSIVLLILLDLSPKKFLEIRMISGILVVAVVLIGVYAAYRIMAGGPVASTIFANDAGSGFLTRIWAFIKYTLPWTILIVPAWIYSEVAGDRTAWRSLLPMKIAFVMGAAILLFSQDFRGGYAIVAVPFGCILVGYWIAHGLDLPQKLASLKTISLILTGIILIASALAFVSIEPIKALAITTNEAIPIAVFVVAAAIFGWLAKKGRHAALIALYVCTVFILSWSIALVKLPGSTSGTISAIENMSTYSPILVYRDDLVMRGYIDYAGIQPIVVNRGIVPIDESVYLAASTIDLDDLMEELNSRMYTQLVASFKGRQTYALIKLSPLAIAQ